MNRTLRRLMRLFLFLVLLVLIGCGDSAPAPRRPLIVATTTVVGDLVRQLAGEEVDLFVMMGPGVDPHTYKPSTSDMGRLGRAAHVFYNGLHLEGKMVEMLQDRLAGRSTAVTHDIPPDRLLSWKAGESGAHDPHVWFDINLWKSAARAVSQSLAKMNPQLAAAQETRLPVLLAKLDELDAYVRQQAASVPAERRILITSHDAFAYFGRAYGFDVRGLQGISTETEAGLANIRDAVTFILARNVPALFVESSVSPKTIQRVQADCRSRGVDVKIGGELYSDAMGSPGEHPGYAVHTYDGMVRYNIDIIVNALK